MGGGHYIAMKQLARVRGKYEIARLLVLFACLFCFL